jgi:hypothetical protein
MTRSAGAAAAAAGALALLLLAALTGCASGPTALPPAPAAVGQAQPAPGSGRLYELIPGRSSLLVLVYRAGPMAALGHNHVIACRCLTGTVRLPRNPVHGSFNLRFSVARLTVDDPALRAAQHSGDFPADVPRPAREGTRRHMLGEALLQAARYPEITLQSAALRPSPDGQPGEVIVKVLVRVDGRAHRVAVPVHYALRAGELVATAAFPLRQSALGLTPYSVLGGALRVRDTMEVRIRLVARPAS